MTASTLRCPGCGAPAAADAARCTYCNSALATVTCASCFAPMFKGSRFCAMCGAEAVRDLVDNDTPLHCPRCRETMQGMQLGSIRVSECAECGGLWVDPAVLQTLCNDRARHNDVIATLSARAAPQAAIADIVRYVPCPACAKLMNRTNFSHISGVIIDVCRHHGIWLDRGEMEHIIAFVESGGLTKQREREIEQLADESRRLRALEARSSNTSYPQDNPQWMPLRGGMGQAESMDGVLAALAGLLHS